VSHSRRASQPIITVTAVFLLIAFPFQLPAADMFADAARELTRKIAANLGPLEKVALTFRNLTSLDSKTVAEAQRAIENEFRVRRLRLAGESEATAKVVITLSENLLNYLWVAEIQRNQAHELVIAVRNRRPGVPAADFPPHMAIQMRLILEQEDPILDLALLDGECLLLDPGHVSLHRRQNDRWEMQQVAAIPHPGPWPRDIRGRLSVRGDNFQAYLPGLSCDGAKLPTLMLECTNEEVLWPLEPRSAILAGSRNFFVLGDLPPFFSAAGIKEEQAQLWIFTGVDGRTRLLDSALRPAGMITGWGSDIAGIDTGCGTGRQILVALPADPSERGSIQAFEVVRRQPLEVSTAAEFPGPITALWPVAGKDAAIAVSRNLRTGRYAAFHLSISCSR
jgi:hypothetical protein